MVKFFFSFNHMRLSEWLKTYRPGKFSQENLAKEITKRGFRISGAQISNYEREYDKDADGNPTRPNRKFLLYAAELLERPVNEALEAAGYLPEPSEAEYRSEIEAVASRLASSVMASGFKDLEDEELVEAFWEDMRTIAEASIKRRLQEQERKRKKSQ
jgi:hypothetical protein